jgi:hypothetical protein
LLSKLLLGGFLLMPVRGLFGFGGLDNLILDVLTFPTSRHGDILTQMGAGGGL